MSSAVYDPDFPTYTPEEIQDCSERAPELEALHRLAMVLHNQYPWDRAQARLQEVGTLADDDVRGRSSPPAAREVRAFLRRAGRCRGSVVAAFAAPTSRARRRRRRPPVVVRRSGSRSCRAWRRWRLCSGEHVCTNEDVIRNAAYNWSPMTADDISRKTGIEARRYTQRGLDEIALEAADAALRHAGRAPEEVGAVIVCTCTSTRAHTVDRDVDLR